jgi:hypothetical protein
MGESGMHTGVGMAMRGALSVPVGIRITEKIFVALKWQLCKGREMEKIMAQSEPVGGVRRLGVIE